MIFKCWGCRGSIPVSGTQYLQYGGDTTCFEIISKEGSRLIIDAGTGIRPLGNYLSETTANTIHLLITHTHWDHLMGLPVFKPLFSPSTQLNIYGKSFCDKSFREIINGGMAAPFFPISFNEAAAQVTINEIEENQELQIENFIITPIKLSHPNQGFGYKIVADDKILVILTDNNLGFQHQGGYSFKDYIHWCRNADLLIHDAEYYPDEFEIKKLWGHSAYTQALELAIQSQVKTFMLTHHNQDRSDDEINRIYDDCIQIIARKNSKISCKALASGLEFII